MRINRIYGMVLRYIYYFLHSFDRMADVFYWPMMDLLLWGLTSIYFRRYMPNGTFVVFIVLSGILLWIMIWRGQYEITVNLLEELWRYNLMNIFASPLTFSEWTASVLIVGIIKASVSFSFASLVGFILYKINIFSLGPYLGIFCLLLIMSGWWVGFIIAGLVFRYGTKIQTFAWSGVMLVSPFSAVYYPLSNLPLWAQNVGRFLPTSYIFEAARQLINGGGINYNYIFMSLILNCVYLALAFIFLKSSFDKALERGLIKVN